MGREHIKNIKMLEGTEIAAIFEPDAEMQARAAALAPEAKFENSFEDLLNRKDLDCLVIVTPNFTHAEQLRQIAQTNPLPLLVEKPLVTNTDDFAFIEEMQESYPAPVWVAMEYRYMPPVAELIRHAPLTTDGIKMLTIREHRFPFLQKVGNWNRFNAKSGGTLVEKCCHFFDLMRLLLKSEPVRVMASAGQTFNHLDETYDGVQSDIWDNGYVIVDFASGARAMLELCMFAEGSQFQEEISAVGQRGKIETFVPGPGRFWPADLGEPPTAKLVLSPRDPKRPETRPIPVDPLLLEIGDHNGSTYYQHQKFQQVLLNNGNPEVTLHDGLMAVKMGMAAQKSALSGQAVAMAQL